MDYKALNIPSYPVIVKNPMDYSTIKAKLNLNCYATEEDFKDDMNLIFDNCLLFNGRESFYGKVALELKLEFATMFKKEFAI